MISSPARALFDSLPSTLRNALAVAVTEDEYANLGTEELRHLARHVIFDAPLDITVIDILADALDGWLDEQSRLQARALDALTALSDTDPIDIANASFPAWFSEPWAQVLRQGWAADLAAAVDAAEHHLAAITIT
jgi:hypothetical protein